MLSDSDPSFETIPSCKPLLILRGPMPWETAKQTFSNARPETVRPCQAQPGTGPPCSPKKALSQKPILLGNIIVDHKQAWCNQILDILTATSGTDGASHASVTLILLLRLLRILTASASCYDIIIQSLQSANRSCISNLWLARSTHQQQVHFHLGSPHSKPSFMYYMYCSL